VRAAAGFEVGLRGAHQLINAACALETVEELQRIIPVSTEAITKGLKEVKWPGRLQLVEREGTKVLLDGAHNPDGATTLRKSIESILGKGEVTLVLGLFRDKEWTKMCDILVPMAAKLYLVPVQSERTADPVEVGRYCKELSPGLEVKAWPTLSAGLDAALKDRVVAVTGSLHLVGEAMEHLGVSPSGRSERLLNEWTAVKPS
jgi:dihydrofolate synthase/folylpolyglutamate synthase